MTSRRVVHLVPRWLPPTEQFVDQLLRRSSYQPVVVTKWGAVPGSAFPRRPILHLAPVYGRVPPRHRGRVLATALPLVLRVFRAGVLHVHFGYETDGVVKAARRGGAALVVSVHGHDVTAAESRSDPALRDALSHADAVIVPSAFLAEAAAQAGARADRIRVLPSGVDLAAFTPSPLPSGPPQVVFVGRFVEKKGLDVLAAAWPRVRAALPDVRLLLLGEGPVPAHELLPDAELWAPDPARREDQVREALSRAHVVVTPSRTASDGDSDSLLLVNVEAQACGRPVVSTRHGGIPDGVGPDSALLVPEADAGALADALVRVLTDRDLAERMAAAGPAFAATLDADRCAARVDALYRELRS